MKRTRSVSKPVRKIFIIAFCVLAFCILVSFLHVFDTKRVFEKQASIYFQDIFDIATLPLDENTTQLKNSLTEAGKEISELEDDSGIAEKLNQLTQKHPGSSAALISDNEVLLGSGNEFLSGYFGNYEFYSKISGSYYNNNYTCLLQSLQAEDEEEILLMGGIYRLKRDVGGNFNYLVAIIDMTDIMQESSYKYVDKMSCACIIDAKGDIISRSPGFDEKIGREQENFYEALKGVSNGHSSQKKKIEKMRQEMAANTSGSFQIKTPSRNSIECYYERINTSKAFYYVTCFDEGLVDDALAGGTIRSFLVCLFLIIVLIVVSLGMWAYMRSSNSLIEKLAYNDEVTGGYNFNYFKMKAMEIISKNPETPFVMCRFDIMNFRYINEAYGHDKADDVLKACVQEFHKIFSNRELCIRVNSDQFLALALNDAEVSNRFQRFNKAVGDRTKENGVRYPIRFKSGFYQIKKDDRDIDVMIDHANAARKFIKTNDNNAMEAFYSESIIANMKKVDVIESEMQVSLGKEEFRVYLQPKWDIVNDCIIGAEALVRWIKKDGSMYYPDEFIPVFEQNGFIEKLDFYMLERVCKQLQELKEKGGYRIVPISINQSRLLINNPDYVKSVERALERHETDVKNIELEITETVFLYEKDKMIEVANQLKDMGLTLAMDDFGSGYSSLNILKDIPFDIMKIDKEFFNEAIASKQSIIILQKIIEMSESLGIEVICEGVETAEQVEMLKGIGCKAVQGYYYSKPIPMDEFIEKYLKEEK